MVPRPEPAERIVSLLPAATEIVCALGFRASLVGRSHECDFPDAVRALPVVTSSSIDSTAPGPAIHERVEELLARGLSLYHVDAERLRALRPTLVVTQVQCDVCAVSVGQVEEALRRFAESEARVVSLAAATLEGVFQDIERVAAALGAPERAGLLVEWSRRRIEAIAARARAAIARGASRPRVVALEWLDPLLGSGNWIPELVVAAGGEPLLARAGGHAPRLTLDDLEAADADAIVAFPCGFPLDRARAELASYLRDPRFASLRAVVAGRLFACDGNAYFNRPGPRLVESLEVIAEALHPDEFRFGREGTGFERAGAR